jgi:HD superfamily phosphodiesterase
MKDHRKREARKLFAEDETIFEEIWQVAKSYLDMRKNDIHTEICINLAFKLIEREGGDKDIVIPAIILHDVGWKEVPEGLHLKAFGPNAVSRELTKIHEARGVKIAKRILQMVHYDEEKIEEILEIINGHDTRRGAISLNDKIVKDADKLWRYTKEGFQIDQTRFQKNYNEILGRLHSGLDTWFFTDSAKRIAMEELDSRINESKTNQIS